MHSSPQRLTAQSKEQTERLTYNYDWFWTVIDLSYSFSKLERKVCPERPLVFMCLNSLLSQIKADLNHYTKYYSAKFHIFSRLWFDRSCNSWWRSPSTRTRARLSGGILSILSKFHWWNDRFQYLESRDSRDQEIARMSQSCLTGVGNVFQWHDFKAHVKGSVKIIKPSCWSEETFVKRYVSNAEDVSLE